MEEVKISILNPDQVQFRRHLKNQPDVFSMMKGQNFDSRSVSAKPGQLNHSRIFYSVVDAR